LVREGHIERCDTHALALYLMLVTVADRQGLSYYGDGRLAQGLSLSVTELQRARERLVAAQLLAYQAPLYQVLDLSPTLSRLGEREKLAQRRALLEPAGD
jgi:hypothetical protein